ncbi:hypothetical protein M378DRAFT_25263 [Amanita muscaria Koide BX008]|uniref:T6SS Phospholipase effector Tle1-like catalytic domain-containing protein n=1 Tax=Amanita muscaria (strain Koide BX008) TaxID=946122 RepID=A0A0C2SIP4_AMAMK|nr:hypothetical protein M378DRAFT_25263 [Amanita muscaria Koide BX008]
MMIAWEFLTLFKPVELDNMLLVFCDGTGSDGNLTLNSGESLKSGSDAKPQYPSNVLFLSRAVKHLSGDNQKRQMVLYLSGVGSEADFHADSIGGAILIQAFGLSVASKIRDAYAFIAQNYEEGDEICLFGFSRGAYTVRKVAGLIDRIGLLRRDSLGYLFGIWLDLYQKKTPTIPPHTRKSIKIKCVGVWDTVGAAFGVIDALSIKDDSPLPNVEVALHALALQENRQKFLPILWNQQKSGKLGPNQVFKQVWFPGAHCDVGGGYQFHELSDLALIWMVGEIESFINLDTAFIQRCLQPNPKPWGTSQPRNAFLDIGFQPIELGLVGTETRLKDIRGDDVEVFHESLKFAPKLEFDSPLAKMITLSDLKQKFHSGWSPNWAPLNDFEKRCRDNWGKFPPEGPITFKTPSTLLNAPKVSAKL